MNRHYFNLKGQALIELATLGTILIFCLGILINYGLQANYQQEVFMSTFRRAMGLAYNQTSNELGPSGTVVLTALDDRRMISPDNAYGLASRSQFSRRESATWSDNLTLSYLDSASQPIIAYQPKTFYMMNGNTIANVSTDSNPGVDKELSYTTASFTKINSTQSSAPIVIRELDLQGHGTPPVYWYNVTLNYGDAKVYIQDVPPGVVDPPKALASYYDATGRLQFFSDADVDGDGKEEQIVTVEGLKDQNITAFIVLDRDNGQMSDDDSNLGLAPGYQQQINHTGSLTKNETAGFINTTTTVSEQGSSIGRTIRWQERVIDPNTGYEISKQIHSDGVGSGAGYDKTFTWSTPK